MVMIKCANLVKLYKPGLFKKKICAVDDVSFEVEEGSVFGLIGPNGAGKSSIIRMLLGLIKPDSGEIAFSGSLERKNLGYLPENPYLYDHLSLRELLFFGGITCGMNRSSIEEASIPLIAKLDLQESQGRPLKSFSKGMLQRAGICFALLHDPSLVILDEPMSGLDPIGRNMVFDLIVELKKSGKTIFFCSHILNDVERLCDRIGLLKQGSLACQFDKDDFFLSVGKKIFLYVVNLTDALIGEIESFGVVCRSELDGWLLAVDEGKYFQVNEFLFQNGIKVLGTREAWMTLEDFFIMEMEA